MDADWQGAMGRARANAPFLARALDRQPELTDLLAAADGEAALRHAGAAGEGAPDLASALRRERLALATALAIGDVAGAFPLARVMSELSAFADRALDQAIGHAIGRRVPDAPDAGFIALALGKHGAQELNYSSDIDPILLYDPETLPRRPRDEPGEAAQAYARTIVELLSGQTGEGYVVRVDLRLRPASEVSPLAISLGAALGHYESSALAWERAAFIRARAVGGDVLAGEQFLTTIRPFVWRRSLDFTALEEIRRLTARIRDAHAGAATPGPGFDLKRGRGGIREIEFYAQTHQLIYGGRNAALRPRGTRAALDALAQAAIIDPADAALLGTAYDRLRTLEHRLQMIDDRQTHSLPAGSALEQVAALDGLASAASLVEEVQSLTSEVAARYDRLLAGEAERSRPMQPANPDRPPDERWAPRIAQWRETMRVLRSGEARAALDAIIPDLTAALTSAPDPDHALARWETLLARLPSAVNLFRLFEQRPGLLEQVLRVLTLAHPLADALAVRPDLLDRLIDTSALDLPGSVESLAARMASGESGDDYERRLDRIRRVVGEERFALGVQLVDARHDPLAISAGLSRVAEAALHTAADAAIAEFEQAHGRLAGSDLLVLGLGRLGGGALTHMSDLDLVYLFTGGIGGESDGRRPLGASHYFNRLAQRITAALSVPTAAGALYQVDTRLRPQGSSGPLAVSCDSFARYQREEAWTWEHMALARARPLYGPAAGRAELTATIHAILERARDPKTLRADVLAMRDEMTRHKPPSGPLDVKLLRGGLVDCEFIVHFLQLRDHAGIDPHLPSAIARLSETGLLPDGFDADHALLSRLLVAARLLAPDGETPPDSAGHALAAACGTADYPSLLQAAHQARQGVARTWSGVFGQTLEIE